MSDIGSMLNQAQILPEPGDRRTLREVLEALGDFSLVRDPEAVAFIVVVKRGDEKRAEDAIVERRHRQFLRNLPRALLLAFTLDMAEGQIMSVRLEPKVVYQGGPELAEGWIEVDADLRLPGADVTDLEGLSKAGLEASIRAWCDRHGVDPDKLVRVRRKTERYGEVVVSPTPSPLQTSALERLYTAQDPHIAKRMTVPMDIALALSRMP